MDGWVDGWVNEWFHKNGNCTYVDNSNGFSSSYFLDIQLPVFPAHPSSVNCDLHFFHFVRTSSIAVFTFFVDPPNYGSLHPSVRLSIRPSIHPSTHQSIHPSAVQLPILSLPFLPLISLNTCILSRPPPPPPPSSSPSSSSSSSSSSQTPTLHQVVLLGSNPACKCIEAHCQAHCQANRPSRHQGETTNLLDSVHT